MEPDVLAKLAAEDAALTHPNRICRQGNGIFATAIAETIREGCSAQYLYERIAARAAQWEVDDAISERIEEAKTRRPPEYSRQMGWVLTAFQNALYELLHAPTLEEGVIATVHCGGDTDTNGAICGALLGAVYGRETIPRQWEERIPACRPSVETTQPRPEEYWPHDALRLAGKLVEAGDKDSAARVRVPYGCVTRKVDPKANDGRSAQTPHVARRGPSPSKESDRSRGTPDMNLNNQTYGDLIRLDLDNRAGEETLQRIPLGSRVADGGMDESSLRDLLFRSPRALPVAAIDAAYSDPVPICTELSTGAGPVDALYVNALGRLILAEFKLWRNPQARREVIGQILDYAKELASWRYEDFQRKVSRALKRTGNVPYELVHAHSPIGVDEKVFVDNVTRHLKRGEFLLLIVGDGIHEGVENIVQFVQGHSGLHFNLALVEAALYRDTANRVIVQPRVLMKTEIIRRVVHEGVHVEDLVLEDGEVDNTPSELEQENMRFWTAVLHNYAFSDVNVDVPEVTKGSVIRVTVRGSGHGDYGLLFVGFLQRNKPIVGCYLTHRDKVQPGVDVYKEVERSLDGLRDELGDDLDQWVNKDELPRIGFWRPVQFPFPRKDSSSSEFEEAVEWMRDRLDRLVSTVHPRLQQMISERE